MDINSISNTGQAPNATLAATHVLSRNVQRVPEPGPVQATVVDATELKQAVETINKSLKPIASGVQFSTDQDTGRTLVKVIDTETQAVLRQIPSEEVLAISKALDKLQGIVIRTQA